MIVFIVLSSAACRDDQATKHWGNEFVQQVAGRQVHAKLSVLGNSTSEPLAAVLILQGEGIAPLREEVSIISSLGRSVISVNGAEQQRSSEFLLYMNTADGSLKRIGVDPSERAIFMQNSEGTLRELLEFWEKRK